MQYILISIEKKCGAEECVSCIYCNNIIIHCINPAFAATQNKPLFVLLKPNHNGDS